MAPRGTWDTHGDNIPPYGGIWNGLRPLLPVFDHLLTTLVSDLEDRGLLDRRAGAGDGRVRPHAEDRHAGQHRRPRSLAGRDVDDHGRRRLRHGQVIGSTERDGGQIKERPVTPGDLAATIYRHMGVPLDGTYQDNRGRPRFYIEHGEPIRELF